MKVCMKLTKPFLAAALLVAVSTTFAKGGSHSAAAPGTGAKSSSTHIHGYVKRDGTHVESHERSKSDKNFENNWTTKGNENPVTGKDGSRVSEPAKK